MDSSLLRQSVVSYDPDPSSVEEEWRDSAGVVLIH